MIYLHYETFNISAAAAESMGLSSTMMVKLKFASNKNRVSLAKYDFENVKRVYIPLLKQIPAGKRSYDPVDYIWTIPADAFDVIRTLVEHDGDSNCIVKHKDLVQDFCHANWNNIPKQTSWTEQIRETESFQQTVEKPEDFFNQATPLNTSLTESELQLKLSELIKPFITFDLNGREDFMRGYKIAARRYHPDVKGGSTEKMSELNSLWMQYKEIGA